MDSPASLPEGWGDTSPSHLWPEGKERVLAHQPVKGEGTGRPQKGWGGVRSPETKEW